MESKRTGREAILLVIVVFLLGIALGGAGTYVWEQKVWGARLEPNRNQLVQQMSREVGLTPEQQTQVHAIVEDVHGKLRTLNQQLDPQRDALRQQGRDRIRAVLTDQQRPKYEEFLRRLDEQRRQQSNKQ
jgi:flagellar biosynthesis chaperone FliJ